MKEFGLPTENQATPADPPSAPKIVSTSEPHMACVFLIDTSDAMAGWPIDSVNKGLQRFIAKIAMNEKASRRVDIAVVGFGGGAYIIQDFMPVALTTEPVTLGAGGAATMGSGAGLAADMMENRSDLYSNMGIPMYRPWIFMITNSAPADHIEDVAWRIREEENRDLHGNLKFFALGAGDFDKAAAFKFTDRVMELTGFDYTGIFNWLGDSILAISTNDTYEEITLGNLPADTRVVQPPTLN